ncbi:Ribonucleases P/MRP protein subunit pop3 [Lachnellula suecica]|uniref:Ribonucleases P/MRP protein subunit pop3 n=1 Tax=Lachnellula suecica TaxID=602035 RepID=A0A8T9C2P3_9HELO|nr:Ribonucleases P/MRP protein subunit pop3 [Lachnellula suecica]
MSLTKPTTTKETTTSKPMERKTKSAFQLDTPFTSVTWPSIPATQASTILELLLHLLTPLGHHRTHHTTPSKGKRALKRKRKSAPTEPVPVPSVPEISSFVVVGLNSITRHLELSSKATKPGTKSEEKDRNPGTVSETDENGEKPAKLAAIFTPPHSTLPAILHTHLPHLIATSSHPTRLIPLPLGADTRIAAALGLPRVSFIGLLEGAPWAGVLLGLVREVDVVAVPWLSEAKKGEYLGVKINAIETVVGVAKEKRGTVA